ncbi:DUF4347 domain-containing protein, partial [Azospirillum sp. ST 5-10]
MQDVLIAAAGLRDLADLLEHRSRNLRVVLVPDGADAHPVLASVLAERPAAIHLLAHGAPGELRLGAHPITADSLADRAWAEAPGSEILIHACDVGAGAAGRRFVERLAAATGTRVAAAAHPVGDAAQGGSWDLDVTSAPVRSAGPFAGHEAWPHLLAVTGTASEGDDTLTSDDGADSVSGLGGNDSLIGGAGNDYLFGNAGDDTLLGGAGRDTLDGGPGADHMDGVSGTDFVSYERTTGSLLIDVTDPSKGLGDAAGDSFANIDYYVLGNLSDTFYGGDGVDRVWAHDGDDLEYGRGGNDELEAGGGNDTIYGDAGNDYLAGRGGNDIAYGGDDDDTIDADGGADLLYGGAGADALAGDQGADTMYGGDGDDSIYAAYGFDAADRFSTASDRAAGQADRIYGEGGNDRYVVMDADDVNASMVYDGGAGSDAVEVRTGEAVDFNGMTLTAVERVELTGGVAHTVTFTAAQINALQSVTGASGDVLRIVGSAADVGDLGGKVDAAITVEFVADPLGDTVSGNISGSDGDDHLRGVATDDTISGLGGNDLLSGDTGHDYLYGNAGDDTLSGGLGNDTLDGGPGADHMDGGSNYDVVSYEQTTGSLVVDLANPADNAGDAAGDTFANVELYVLGNQDDTFVGGDGNDQVWAHNGDDVEYGGLGNDSLEAGGGNDTQYGEAGDDYIAGRADDDLAYGGEGNDLIEGDGGSDVLYGGAGNDSLAGDAEADTMYGGAGDDSFYNAYDIRDDDGVRRGFNTQTAEERVGGQPDQMFGEDGNDRFVVVDADDVNGAMRFDGGAGTDSIEVTTSESVNFHGMTLTSVERLDLTGDGTHDVKLSAAQVNGLQSITGGEGDVLRIVGTAEEVGDLSGKVGAGIDIQFTDDAGGAAGSIYTATQADADLRNVDLTGVTEIRGTFAGGMTITLTPEQLSHITRVTTTPETNDGDWLKVIGTDAGETVDLSHVSLNNIDFTWAQGDEVATRGAADSIIGSARSDELYGKFGNDTVYGGEGWDILGGGPGDDLFLFESHNNGVVGGRFDGLHCDYLTDFGTGGGGLIGDVIRIKDVSLTSITDGYSSGIRMGEVRVKRQDGNDPNFPEDDNTTPNTVLMIDTDTVPGVDIFLRINGEFVANDFVIESHAGYSDIYLRGRTPQTGGDTLSGGDGGDTLSGGDGGDTLSGGDGGDTLSGGDGGDTLSGGDGGDTLSGGDGGDTLSGGDGGDTLSGGDGGDTLSGGDGGDTLSGGDGGDTLSGGDGGDTLSGGDGGDTLSGGDGGDTVGGGDGGSGGGSDGGG